VPLAIDAGGSKVLYRKQGVYLLDLRTLESTLLIPDGQSATGVSMSDDARSVLFLREGVSARYLPRFPTALPRHPPSRWPASADC
jgi:hypothetical protein